MRTLFSSLVTLFVLLFAASYAWTHMRQVSLVAPAAVHSKDSPTPPTYAEAQEAQKLVTMTGLLADYMAHQEGPPQSPRSGDATGDSGGNPGQAGRLRSRWRIGRWQQPADSESDVSRAVDGSVGL